MSGNLSPISASQTSRKISRGIPEIEGLRGLLALWVFVFHTLSECNLHLPILSDGGAAVSVFMIISGFVITRMQIYRREPYRIYILRRFARIYPVYLIAIGIGISISGLTSENYSMLPWKVEDSARLIGRHALEQAHFVPLLLAHLTLLHGLFPENFLPGSSLTFVPAAWSLSLEWQFYLIAPLLIAAVEIRSAKLPTFCAIIALMVIGKVAGHHFTFIVPSFLPMVLFYFVVGCMSAYLCNETSKIESNFALYGFSATLIILLSFGFLNTLPYLIWLILMCIILKTKIPGMIALSRFLSHPMVTYFGDRSYSFYLLHQAALACCLAVLLRLGFHTRLEVFPALLIGAFLVTFTVSVVLYKIVEKPIINWAKRFGTRNLKGAPKLVDAEPVVTGQ